MLERHFLTLAIACLSLVGRMLAAPQAPPPPPAREFRAAWVATVNNIDWPSRPGLPAAAARAELAAIVERAAALGLNALVFQVRPCGDAFYRSDLEPWSEWLTGAQGRAPDEAWDPLQFVVDRCHARGLQLHAWFNPYRARHPSSKTPEAPSHVLRRQPDACVTFGSYRWMDPGDPRSAAWTLAVIRDVVRRYDIDGVHLDDYFYPYPEKKAVFADDASWTRYRRGGGRLGRDDWRRQCIDQFVADLYAMVHREKPWLLVGISPFGIARPGVPKGIAAGIDQYAQLYADVPRWLAEGWVDYLAPQLYWPIDQTAQSFPTLLAWWRTQNPRQRHLWPGVDAGRIVQGKPPSRPDELRDQIELTRRGEDAPGHVLYSFRALRSNDPRGAGALAGRIYLEPAVAPASPWLGGAAPPTPVIRLEHANPPVVHWNQPGDARFVAVQVHDGTRWRGYAVAGAAAGAIDLPAGTRAVAVTAIGRTGLASGAAIERP